MIEKLRADSYVTNLTDFVQYVHVFSTHKSDESKGKCEDTEGGEDEGAREGGERQREDGREAAATTRTPP